MNSSAQTLWIPLYHPCFGVGGEEKRERGGNPRSRCGWLSPGWDCEGWTDRHDPDSLSPARKRQHRTSGSSVSQPVPLQLWGFLCLICSSHTARPQLEESLLPVTDGTQQRHQKSPSEVDCGHFQASTQLKRDLCPKGSWQSSSLPISFADLALLSM